MKLRNKKTGEINLGDLHLDDFNSLAELNEEWEDYEEPKSRWFIDPIAFGHVDELKNYSDEEIENVEELGFGFATEKEALKTVDKLKAWKRLKDKGFEIEGWDNYIGDDYYKTGQIVINLNNVKNRDWDEYDNIDEIKDDLNLLFGGEE